MRAQGQVSGPKQIMWIGVLGILLTGVYNSIQLNSDTFMNKDLGIRFVKRLDELHGKITVGRMAASTIQWRDLETKKKVIQENKVQITQKAEKKAEDIVIAEPAITAELNLNLDQIFFKKPFEKGSFTGHARTSDGYIDEIVVNLPNGKTLYIDARDRMVGNVFTYEDTQTGELKSGMFYEVKNGKQYMITLTNDSVYAGLRLGFTSGENTDTRYGDLNSENKVEWAESDFGSTKSENNQNSDQKTDDLQEDNKGGQRPYGFNFNPTS